MEGTVTFFSASQHYGKVVADDPTVGGLRLSDEDVIRTEEFGWRSFPIQGDRVRFEIDAQSRRGRQAKNIFIIQSALQSESDLRPEDTKNYRRDYWELGTLLPPAHGIDHSFIVRPDGEHLYAKLNKITEGLDRVLSGETLPCSYLIKKWIGTKNGDFRPFYEAIFLKLYEP